MVLGEVRRTFNPEFINRIDEIIVFEALSDDDLRRITELLVGQLNANLVDRRLKIALTPEAIDWIIELTCKDRSYGARPLRRAIQRYIEDPLAEELIRGDLKGGEVEVYSSGRPGLSGPDADGPTPRPAGVWPRASNSCNTGSLGVQLSGLAGAGAPAGLAGREESCRAAAGASSGIDDAWHA